MWLFKFGVPILAILGFGHAVYEVFTDKIDAEKMRLTRPTAHLLWSVGGRIMATPSGDIHHGHVLF